MSAFTPAQESAIAACGNVLVVAGAGTGKTRTLIERVLRRLQAGDSLDRFLLVTFTEAAAAEMRVRLRRALEAGLAAAEDPAAQQTRSALSPEASAEQLALLETAQISTLHSFCLSLVREHFHQLAIDPQLVILDERQTRPLARDCLTVLLAEHYAGRHPHSDGVQQLVRRAGRGSDEPLRALVWKLHSYVQSLPDPDPWFAAQLVAFREPSPARWEQWLAEALAEWRARWQPAFADLADVPALRRSAAALAEAAFRVPQEAMAEILAADATENWKRRKGELRPPFESFFAEASFFHGLLAPQKLAGDAPTRTALADDWEWSRHGMAALVELTRQFTARFSEAKRQLGGVDFADLEQFALRLLRDERTGVARRCQARFKHVCVDEYQDINGAQDAILAAVSGTGPQANRFLVGDLKQSIYRFRLANPRIFAGYAGSWRNAGTVIALSENFRSRAAILDFANPLFRLLLREGIGGVVYGDEAELKFGAPEQRAALRSPVVGGVGLHVLTKEAQEPADESEAANDLSDLLAVEREARCVALRLRELHTGRHPVWDEGRGAFRPVEWRDMVVLMRSPGSRVEAFAQEFHRAGVPLQASRGGFYGALEVSDLLNLLRLLDNPLQDVPLLAVLRSPLVAMSLPELVAVRAHNSERPYWDALVRFRAARPETGGAETAWVKADGFLARFAAWRERLRFGSLTDCLERVLAETHYESLLLAEPRGAERVANVRRLLDLARQFDPHQRQGLHRFLQFIAAQEEADLDHDPAPPQTDDAVRLMSIHQSKGLEFPVVVVAGLGTRFNERDLRGDILLDEELGLCPMVWPPGRERRYASLPHWLAARRGRRELLGEELRLLYVAITRARDTLLLVGTEAGKDVAARWRGPVGPVTDQMLLKARCPLDWLRAWLPGVTREGDWHGDAAGRNDLLTWDFYPADDGRLRGAADASAPIAGPCPEADSTAAAADIARLRAKLEWRYGHAAATWEPAKTSVTVLRRRAFEADEESVPWPRVPAGHARRLSGALTAAERGVAHHTFLQGLDFTRAATELDLRNEAARLVAVGLLTARESDALDFADLLQFCESTVGRAVRTEAAAGRVQREVPFTARFTVAELAGMGLLPGVGRHGEAGHDEFLIVQGVADLVVFRPAEIWLLDYKTDHFPEAELAQKVRDYGPQLSLYALALERIHGRRVTRTWLHFLALARTEPL